MSELKRHPLKCDLVLGLTLLLFIIVNVHLLRDMGIGHIDAMVSSLVAIYICTMYNIVKCTKHNQLIEL